MAKIFKITGISTVLGNLKRANENTVKKVSRGLKKGGLFLEREATKIVPVDKNILRPGVETRNVGGGGVDTDIIVTYGPNEYAVYVHEDMDARHKPGKKAKFLEGPAREKKKQIFAIVAKG